MTFRKLLQSQTSNSAVQEGDFLKKQSGNSLTKADYYIKSTDIHLNYNNFLGSGCHSSVYLGTHKDTPVAIKILRDSNQADVELNIWIHIQNIQAPNMLKLYGYNFDRKSILVTEYFGGISLEDYLKKHKEKIKWTITTKIIIDLTDGIAFLHKHGIVHRDIKPDNILINPTTYVVRICDVDAAKVVDDQKESMRSPLYCAPEMLGYVNSKNIYTPACDVYSLSLSVWQFVTKSSPYDDIVSLKDLVNHVKFQGKREPVPANIPNGIAAYITFGWMHNPKYRFTAEKLATLARLTQVEIETQEAFKNVLISVKPL
jgi:serine/threonine protein kinase